MHTLDYNVIIEDLEKQNAELLAALVDLLDQIEGIGIPDWHGAEGLSLEQAQQAVESAK